MELERSFCRMKPEIALSVAESVFLSDFRKVLPKVMVPTSRIQSKKDIDLWSGTSLCTQPFHFLQQVEAYISFLSSQCASVTEYFISETAWWLCESFVGYLLIFLWRKLHYWLNFGSSYISTQIVLFTCLQKAEEGHLPPFSADEECDSDRMRSWSTRRSLTSASMRSHALSSNPTCNSSLSMRQADQYQEDSEFGGCHCRSQLA